MGSAVESAWEVAAKVAGVLATGGLMALFAALKRRRRRMAAEADARHRDRELLKLLALAIQVLIEKDLWEHWRSSTGRFSADDGLIHEQAGAYRQREREVADKLRNLLDNDRREVRRYPQARQDMFRAADLSDEDRERGE